MPRITRKGAERSQCRPLRNEAILWQAGDLGDLPLVLKNLLRTTPHRCCLLHAAVQERHDLRSGAVCIGREGRGGRAVGNVLLDGPQHRVSIVSASGNIRERVAAARCGGLLSAPQERHNLRSRAVRVRRERRVAGTLGDPVLDCPQDGAVIIAACGFLAAGSLRRARGRSRPGRGCRCRRGRRSWCWCRW